MHVRNLLVLLTLLVATPALADFEWALTCEDNPPTQNIVSTTTQVGRVGGSGSANKFACYNFETEDSSVPHDSSAIRCDAPSCMWSLNPSDDQDGTDLAQGWIRCCFGPPSVAINDFNCGRTTDSVLNGARGAAGTQTFSVRTGPATCYAEVTAAGAVGDNPMFTVVAED